MSDPATKARNIAQHCEAKKHALRQTQDGIVVAFVLHPNDVPPALQLAALGTRYMLALVEIGDDEQPREVMPADTKHHAKPATPPASDQAAWPAAPVRALPPVALDKRLTKQAVMACKDIRFQTFLYEHDMAIERSEEHARTAVHLICSVKSRSEIAPGTPAGEEWNILYSKFIAWKIAA